MDSMPFLYEKKAVAVEILNQTLKDLTILCGGRYG